jgi:glycosyltransferase involved in cell wall biosynthesis
VSRSGRATLSQSLRIRAADPRGPGFVWFAGQDWWYHNQSHSDFQLMRNVADQRTVLVVNSLGLRVPTRSNSSQPVRRIAHKLASMARFVRRPVPDLPRFHVMTPVMLPVYGDSALARWNRWLIRQQVRLVARAIGLGSRPHVGVTLPSAGPIALDMDRASLLFNRVDLHSAFPGADTTWLEGLENDLLRHADQVLYVSHELMAHEADVVGDRAHFLDHGVDVDHFTRDEAGDALADIPRPRVGFFGALDDYLVDVELLERTARELPEASLVLVGAAPCDLEPVLRHPNAHWLGFRPYAEIPSLGSAFDVGLMPWHDNEWIRYANPIKLKEYLALGLPVVSTYFPEVREYEPLVAVAHDRDDFPALVRDALASPGDPAARRSSILACSWRARAEDLVHVADALVKRPRATVSRNGEA